MAIHGGATTAYWVSVAEGAWRSKPTTALRSICAKPDDAVQKVLAGERALVAGGDVEQVRRAVKKAQAEQDARPLSDSERVSAFLTELTALTRRYGIVVNACGCCDSPYLTPIEDDESGPQYRYTVAKMTVGQQSYFGDGVRLAECLSWNDLD